MFIGHYALALGSKKLTPKTSLGTLMLATGFIDVLWPFFLLLNIEQVKIDPGNTAVTPLDFVHYPYSHSLLMCTVWALLFSFIYFKKTKNKKGMLVLFILVISHWVLDLITHRADLPLSIFSTTKFGFGLWNYKITTIVIETLMYLFGCFIYLKSTKALNKIGSIGFLIFFSFLFLMYLANIFGPPPPNEIILAKMAPVILILYYFPYWIDKNRTC